MRDLDSGTRAAAATHVSFLQLFIGESDNKSIKKKIKGEKTESWGTLFNRALRDGLCRGGTGLKLDRGDG